MSMDRSTAFKLWIPVIALSGAVAGCGTFGWGDPSAEDIEAALRVGDYAKGRDLLTQATEDGDASADVLTLSARIHLDAGDGIRAEKALREAALERPASKPIQALLGEALARQRKPQPALSLTKKSGDRSAYFYVVGLNALFADDAWKARENFEKAYEIDPGNERIAIDLAYARSNLGLFDLATEVAGKTSVDMPANLRAHKALADIALRKHDTKAALLAYERILKISPNDEGALLAKARTLIMARKYAAADTLLQSLPDEVRGANETKVMLGKVAARRGRFEEAYEHFSGVRDAVETDDEAMFLFGLTNVRRGQPWTGINLMEAALRSRPDLPEYHAGVIHALQSVGDAETVKQRIATIPENLRNAKELSAHLR
jgi:Tfp pilus assembly protein PilF